MWMRIHDYLKDAKPISLQSSLETTLASTVTVFILLWNSLWMFRLCFQSTNCHAFVELSNVKKIIWTPGYSMIDCLQETKHRYSGQSHLTRRISRLLQSFSGALLCCAWSYDNRYIATGGEDDLVCVYGLLEQRQVFFGEGHESWITRIAFDRW